MAMVQGDPEDLSFKGRHLAKAYFNHASLALPQPVTAEDMKPVRTAFRFETIDGVTIA